MIDKLCATRQYGQQTLTDITPLSVEGQRPRFDDVDSFISGGSIAQEAPEEAPESEATSKTEQARPQLNKKDRLYNELLAAILEKDEKRIKEIQKELASDEMQKLTVSEKFVELLKKVLALNEKTFNTTYVLSEGLVEAGKKEEAQKLIPALITLKENGDALTKVSLLIEADKFLAETKKAIKELEKN